jgi:hypothetical protein
VLGYARSSSQSTIPHHRQDNRDHTLPYFWHIPMSSESWLRLIHALASGRADSRLNSCETLDLPRDLGVDGVTSRDLGIRNGEDGWQQSGGGAYSIYSRRSHPVTRSVLPRGAAKLRSSFIKNMLRVGGMYFAVDHVDDVL